MIDVFLYDIRFIIVSIYAPFSRFISEIVWVVKDNSSNIEGGIDFDCAHFIVTQSFSHVEVLSIWSFERFKILTSTDILFNLAVIFNVKLPSRSPVSNALRAWRDQIPLVRHTNPIILHFILAVTVGEQESSFGVLEFAIQALPRSIYWSDLDR